MIMIMKKQYILFIILLVMLTAFSGCTATPTQQQNITRNVFLLDTVVNFTIYNSDDQALADTLVEQCAAYEKIFDRTDPESELHALNHAGGKPIEVSTHLLTVLQCALDYAEATNGRFDPTICPVTDLWDFTAESPSLPDPDALQQALSHVGWQNVEIQGSRVQLNNGAKIDLGGIAKGYIADQLAETLRQNDVQSAWINLGGNIITVGGRPDGNPFRIGIQQPFEERTTIIGTVAAQDQSVVSSGVYERCFWLDDAFYHHILDPATGYPADSNLDGVTVIADRSMDADALSTCIFLFGVEQGLVFAQEMGVHAVLIDTAGNIHFTPELETALQFQKSES